MTDKQKSRLFVTVQFIILAIVFFVPAGDVPAGTPSWILIVGDNLVWLGLGMVLLSIFKLGQSLTASPIPKPDSQLKTDGLYKWMRHPIYTGLILTTLGLAMEVGSAVKLLLVIGLVVLFHFKAKWEEAFLLERYPEYREYMTKTGRFFPRVNR